MQAKTTRRLQRALPLLDLSTAEALRPAWTAAEGAIIAAMAAQKHRRQGFVRPVGTRLAIAGPDALSRPLAAEALPVVAAVE